MVSTMKFIGRIVPIVIIVIIGSFETTSANKICQSIVRKVVMKHCSGVPSTIASTRAKRDLEHPEVHIADWESSAAENERSEYRYPVKRQLDAGAAIASVAAPFVSEMITGALTRRPSYSPPMGARLQPAPYPYALPYPGVPQYYVAAAPPPSESRFGRGFLPQANGEDLGFDLTIDEMEELYNEISNRLARNSGMNDRQRTDLFVETVAKCCPNENLCYKELTGQNLINCA